jgi:ubiquinone/menaquinone biosynthesis C-methylase UbiE
VSFYEDRIFPHLLDWATRPVRRDRETLIGLAEGRVLELGAGTGANFPYYSHRAIEVHGLEPAGALLERARETAEQCNNPERFILAVGSAEELPYPEDYFDTVVACLVFCTIPRPDLAAAEMHRVLKPGGRVLTLEHVASEKTLISRVQRGINPVWKKLACGCHLDRDTASVFANAGFDLTDTRHVRHEKLPAIAAELFTGTAVKP